MIPKRLVKPFVLSVLLLLMLQFAFTQNKGSAFLIDHSKESLVWVFFL